MAIAATGALLIHLWDQIAPLASRNPAVLLALIVSETLIGALIGLMARLYVLALQFIASAIAMLIGYGGAGGAGIDEPDPQAALGSLISFSALMLLFVFDFHHEIIKALVMSYDLAPVSALFNPQTGAGRHDRHDLGIVHGDDPAGQPVHRLCDPGQPGDRLHQQADPANPGLLHLAALRDRRRARHPLFRDPDDAQPVCRRFRRRDDREVGMATRKERLKKLVSVQEQLKALHEMRRAGFLAEASSAESEAAELRERFDAEGSLSALFPEIYHRRIDQALMRAASNLDLASEEAGRVATATARTKMVERAYREVSRQDERDRSRPRAARADRPRQARSPTADSLRQVRLRQAFPGIVQPTETGRSGFLGDLPTERHRARRCACRRAATLETARARLASRTAAAAAGLAEAFSLGDLRNSPLAGRQSSPMRRRPNPT